MVNSLVHTPIGRPTARFWLGEVLARPAALCVSHPCPARMSISCCGVSRHAEYRWVAARLTIRGSRLTNGAGSLRQGTGLQASGSSRFRPPHRSSSPYWTKPWRCSIETYGVHGPGRSSDGRVRIWLSGGHDDVGREMHSRAVHETKNLLLFKGSAPVNVAQSARDGAKQCHNVAHATRLAGRRQTPMIAELSLTFAVFGR